jgi:hypothetical protein
MEIFLSAVLGELATRSMSFVINKYSKLPVPAMEINLERPRGGTSQTKGCFGS